MLTLSPPCTLRDLMRSHSLDGYRAGPPPWGLREYAQMDLEQAAQDTCPQCGHRGLLAHQYYNREPRSYRCIFECPVCEIAFDI